MSVFLLGLGVKTILVVSVCMLILAYLTLAELKLMGYIQLRHGPNRVGYWGILQPIADGIKAFMKEEVTPANADKKVFRIAPIISIAAPMLLLAVIPFGDTVTLFGREFTLYLSNPDIGILFVLGISTLGSYGNMLGGWHGPVLPGVVWFFIKTFASGHVFLWTIGVFTAGLTAFYMFRLIFMTFLNQ